MNIVFGFGASHAPALRVDCDFSVREATHITVDGVLYERAGSAIPQPPTIGVHPGDSCPELQLLNCLIQLVERYKEGMWPVSQGPCTAAEIARVTAYLHSMYRCAIVPSPSQA
jgi:hypothetical protein